MTENWTSPGQKSKSQPTPQPETHIEQVSQLKCLTVQGKHSWLDWLQGNLISLFENCWFESWWRTLRFSCAYCTLWWTYNNWLSWRDKLSFPTAAQVKSCNFCTLTVRRSFLMVLQNLSWPPVGQIAHCSPPRQHVRFSGGRCRSLTSFHSRCCAIFLFSSTLFTDNYKLPVTS